MSLCNGPVTANKLFPNHWEMLSEDEKRDYQSLQKSVSSSANRNRRNKSAETFNEMLISIKNYVMRDDGGETRRALVCGLFWVTCFVVVNTKQICVLTGRSKSSINSSFQALGYQSPPDCVDTTNIIINCFSNFKNNYNELRQWTVRALSSDVQKAMQSSIPLPIYHQNQKQGDSESQKGISQLQTPSYPPLTSLTEYSVPKTDDIFFQFSTETNIFDDSLSFISSGVDNPHGNDLFYDRYELL